MRIYSIKRGMERERENSREKNNCSENKK